MPEQTVVVSGNRGTTRNDHSLTRNYGPEHLSAIMKHITNLLIADQWDTTLDSDAAEGSTLMALIRSPY